MPEFMHGKETHALLGACFEVYRDKGCDFLKRCFKNASNSSWETGIFFSGPNKNSGWNTKVACSNKRTSRTLSATMRLFWKSRLCSKLTDEHRAQLHNYLKATGLRVGLLVNFGHYPLVEHERIVR
jgi:GxxExxY protein